MNREFTTKYTPPTVTVDLVAFSVADNTLTVLLVRRKTPPFKDYLALPGGYAAQGQTTREAMESVLRRKTGMATSKFKYIEQLYIFDSVARDPRGHAVSITYLGLTPKPNISRLTSDEAADWYAADSVKDLAFDHEHIIRLAAKKLSSKMNYTNIARTLLPDQFTLSELQTIYEVVLNKKLDKRNFRKKYLKTGFIKSTNKKTSGNSHRPAELYRFVKNTLTEIDPFI